MTPEHLLRPNCPREPGPSIEELWKVARDVLQSVLSSDIYGLWFAPLRPMAFKDGKFTLEAPNDFSAVWLKDNYYELLREALAHATGQEVNVVFVTPQAEAPPQRSSTALVPKNHPSKTVATSPRTPEFNPRNTFDTFVVGNNNNFAHAACLAVAQAPGRSYNPLFLYGGVGLGKTHLLHAIGQHVVQQNSHRRVAYLSSEKFTNEYIAAIQENQLARFRRKYRQTDVLLIDDIQFLAGKERIQEEFFHTFNALHEGHKQIVLTCDRPANEIKNLEQRLISRFEWGLVTDLQPPDIEVRVAILQRKAKDMNVRLPEEVIEFLAKRIRTNIRRLEGALLRVASYASLTGRSLSHEVVENLLREVLNEEGRQSISIELIQKKVAEHYDIRVADMTSKRRPESIAFPRQVAMFLSRQLTTSSLNTIGEAFGGRDHGTVLHACRLVKGRMEIDEEVRQQVNYLEKQLQR